MNSFQMCRSLYVVLQCRNTGLLLESVSKTVEVCLVKRSSYQLQADWRSRSGETTRDRETGKSVKVCRSHKASECRAHGFLKAADLYFPLPDLRWQYRNGRG